VDRQTDMDALIDAFLSLFVANARRKESVCICRKLFDDWSPVSCLQTYPQ
jgi:hypothetical protein